MSFHSGDPDLFLSLPLAPRPGRAGLKACDGQMLDRVVLKVRNKWSAQPALLYGVYVLFESCDECVRGFAYV